MHFQYSKGSLSIRLMPMNYCALIFLPDTHRWIIDFDHAIETKVLAQVIDCMKSRELIGVKDGYKIAEYLNENINLGTIKQLEKRLAKKFQPQ